MFSVDNFSSIFSETSMEMCFVDYYPVFFIFLSQAKLSLTKKSKVQRIFDNVDLFMSRKAKL